MQLQGDFLGGVHRAENFVIPPGLVPEEIRGAGGEWIDAEVVVDGNLVSSRWPPDLPAFCREMMAAVERIRTSRR